MPRTPAVGPLLALLGAMLAALTLAPRTFAESQAPASIEEALEPGDFGAEAILIVHYIRPDQDYTGWNLWTWAPGADGRAAPFEHAADGAPHRYAVVPVDPDTARQGFIVRRGEWAAKDVGHDRFADLDDDGVTEVFLVSGDPRVYTDPERIDLSVRLTNAFLDSSDTIHLAATGLLDPDQTADARILRDGKPTNHKLTHFHRSSAQAAARLIYQIKFRPPVAPEHVASLSLDVPGHEPLTVYARDVLTEPDYTPLDARLGPIHSADATTFRVWSPVASSVELLLYDAHHAPTPDRTIPMTRADKGVWETTVDGDLHNTAYQYRLAHYGDTRTVPDIYTRAATLDSDRSIVVDLDRTDPPGWAADEPPTIESPTDELIYEIHVRDFTIADHSLDRDLRGTYLGLLHEGEVAGVRTGLAHLHELGVTAVHLMPIHDFPSPPGEYNWGYWTSLFNVPESNYTTDPSDTVNAITELKTAIAGLHDAGIRVILDVVYNHTSSSFEHSPFDSTVPWYYFRTSIDGQLLNDAGVGNSIADERPMVRKYITDSLAYWTTEYNIDGYRFDLLGTHHPETVRAICETLESIRPDLTIYGEPWTGGGPVHFPKGAQKHTCFAVFNDHLRNAIRGDLDGTATGFATGPGLDLGAMRRGIAGAIDDFAADPTESVNYASAHDNLTLWDKILKTNPRAQDPTKQAMQKLAIGAVLTSQGIPFLHAGSDFARTKGGNHNSYNAGDEVNKIDWVRKDQYLSMFNYVQGLAALRAAHPAFRMSTAEQVRDNLAFIDVGTSLAFTLDGAAVGDEWDTILVAYNAEPHPQILRFPDGRWSMVVNHRTAGTKTIRKLSGLYRMPPYSMTVFHK